MKLIYFFVILILSTHCYKDSLPQTQPPNIKQTYFVNADSGLKIRLEPNQKSNSIQTIFNGEEVLVLEESKDKMLIDRIESNWVKIQYQEKIGWVFKGFLSKQNPFVGKYEMENPEYGKCSYSEYFYINIEKTWKGNFFIGGDEGNCGYTEIEGVWYLQKNQICFKIKKASSSHVHYFQGVDPCYYLQKNILYADNEKYAFKENFGNRTVNGIRKIN